MTVNTPETVGGGHPDKPWEWKPGQSGNPNGRPKDQFSFMGILRSALAEKNKAGRTVGERIVARYIKLGLAGNQPAIEALMARIDGKPTQSLTLRGDTDAPLHVRHSARLEVPAKPGPELADPDETDTAHHLFNPSQADAALCATCGEVLNWHPHPVIGDTVEGEVVDAADVQFKPVTGLPRVREVMDAQDAAGGDVKPITDSHKPAPGFTFGDVLGNTDHNEPDSDTE